MKKGKEWLKEEINKTMETASYKSIFYSPRMSRILYDDLIKVVDQLDEPEITDPTISKKETVVIPQFVAQYIDSVRREGATLLGSMDYFLNSKEIKSWMRANQELFAKAWLDGYTIEQPKLLTVIVKDYDKTIMTKQMPEDEINKMMEEINND